MVRMALSILAVYAVLAIAAAVYLWRLERRR